MKPLRGKYLQQVAESAIYTNPVDGHNCMKHKPRHGERKFTCPCGKYYELAGCSPGDYWEEKTASTTEFIPYPTQQIESDREIIELLKQYFHFHNLTEYTELTFLIIGIIYFLEAIVKNTLEMLRASGVY